jgi:hypothetical protein
MSLLIYWNLYGFYKHFINKVQSNYKETSFGMNGFSDDEPQNASGIIPILIWKKIWKKLIYNVLWNLYFWAFEKS